MGSNLPILLVGGDADGMVSGAVNTTQHTIRPTFQLIRAAEGDEFIFSVFLMSLADRVRGYGDCMVNDLSRGCSVTDIVYTVAITAIQVPGSGD